MKSIFDNPFASEALSRRDFLKLGGMGVASALSLFISPQIKYILPRNQTDLYSKFSNNIHTEIEKIEDLSPNQQGRVLDASVFVYDIPSFKGTRVNNYWRDWVLPITGITIGSTADSFNMVWYKIGDVGFIHSGSIQPVFTITNPVITQLPPEGVLAEVTVPFTDARWDPGLDKPVAYRFYYGTTNWVVDLDQDADNKPWYVVRDDKWEYLYYVPAYHLRFIPAEELKPISPDVPPDKKRIEVHIPEQVMIAYEFDQPVFMARVASGAIFRDGNYSTPPGWYRTFHKRASRHMARGNLADSGYDLPGVPWNSYITEDGIAFHGTYWHNNFGRPRSHGCINLSIQAAKWVYLWTNPIAPPQEEDTFKDTGTNVEVIE